MSDKKKLLIIVPTMHQGGQERVVVRSSHVLKDYFDITIAIFDGSDIGYDVSGLNIVNIDVPAKPGRINKLINIIHRTIRIKQLKKRINPDISYSYGPSANIINSLSVVKNRKEISGQCSQTWTGLRNYTDATETGKMKLCVKYSDLIVCCARDIETEVHKRYGEGVQTAVLYNLYHIDGIKEDSIKELPDEAWFEFCGINHEGYRIFDYGTADLNREAYKDVVMETSVSRVSCPSRPYHIMSMGRADDQKMFWHMLKIFKLIRDKKEDVFLTIMGAGDWDMYRKLADELGISDVVWFAGPQSNPYKYLHFGDINLMTTRNEGFPNALVEGMALSLAAVSTNCLTGPAEILIDGGDCYLAEQQFSGMREEQAADKPVVMEHNVSDEHTGCGIALYGDYGVLLPAMDRNRNMDASDIPDEDKNAAAVILDLLDDKERLSTLKEKAGKRALDFSYEAYRDNFLKLSGMNS